MCAFQQKVSAVRFCDRPARNSSSVEKNVPHFSRVEIPIGSDESQVFSVSANLANCDQRFPAWLSHSFKAFASHLSQFHDENFITNFFGCPAPRQSQRRAAGHSAAQSQ